MTHALNKCYPGEHNYEGRYDEVVSEVFGAALHEPFPKDKLYVRDVCTKCGDTIERRGKPNREHLDRVQRSWFRKLVRPL